MTISERFLKFISKFNPRNQSENVNEQIRFLVTELDRIEKEIERLKNKSSLDMRLK